MDRPTPLQAADAREPLRMQLSPARTLTVTGTFAVVVAL